MIETRPHTSAPAAPAVPGAAGVRADADPTAALLAALADPDPAADADVDAALDHFAAWCAAAMPADHSAAARLDYAECNPREYASDRLAAAQAGVDEAWRLDPDDRAGCLTDALARADVETLRVTVHRLHRDRHPAGIAMFARHARDMSDHYSGLFDPDPRRFGAIAEAYAAIAAMLCALLTFLRATAAPAGADDNATTTSGPTPERAAADPPPPAGRLLAAVLIAAPAAPPRPGAAACA